MVIRPCRLTFDLHILLCEIGWVSFSFWLVTSHMRFGRCRLVLFFRNAPFACELKVYNPLLIKLAMAATTFKSHDVCVGATPLPALNTQTSNWPYVRFGPL